MSPSFGIRQCLSIMAASASLFSGSAAFAQWLPNFENEGKNIPGFPEPNQRFVVLNSGIANIAAQRFALPKDAQTFPLAGMTVFPYYQASAPLKEFLNNATIAGMPITQFPATPQLPQFTLPPTDYIRISAPIPQPNLNSRNSVKFAIRDRRTRDEVPWMVADQGGQAFALPGDPDALVLVSAGTMFGACASRTMILRCGTMWVMTASRPAAVLTKHGAVCVRPHSIAAVEQTWFNQVRAADLFGQALEVQLSSQGKTGRLALEKGKELKIQDAMTASSGAADYVDQIGELPAEYTKVAEHFPNVRLNLGNVDVDKTHFLTELKTVDPPFSNLKLAADFQKMFSDFGISPAMRRAEMQKQRLESYKLASKYALRRAGLQAQNPAVPFDMAAAPKFPQVSDNLSTLKLRQGAAKYLSNAELGSDENNRPLLKAGEAIFVAEQPLQIHSNNVFVYCRKGAVVHLLSKNGCTVVHNISEAEPDSVKVRVNNHNFVCELGAELVIGNNAPSIFELMKNDGVARRNVRTIEASSGTIVVNKCESDMTSLMQYSPIMRKLYKSKDVSDKELVLRLMKTNVALNMVTGSRGGYRRMAGLPAAH